MTASTGEEGRLDPAPNRKGAIPADSFANRLMLSRAHAGNIAIREAALKCGLNYGSWSNWERGGMPRDLLETVRKISDGLGIDDEWLLFGGALAGRSWRDRAQKNGGGNMTQCYPVPTRGITRVDHPRDTRPNGGPSKTVPPAATRRPVRLGLDLR